MCVVVCGRGLNPEKLLSLWESWIDKNQTHTFSLFFLIIYIYNETKKKRKKAHERKA